MKNIISTLVIFTFLLSTNISVKAKNLQPNANLETAVAQSKLITKVIITADTKVQKKDLSISANNDLYLAKKVKIKGRRITIPLIVDPSLTSGSLLVTATTKNQVLTNSVEPSLIASQKAARFNNETGMIEISSSLSSKKIKGFLLKSNEQSTIKKAIRLKGKANSTNDTISFKVKNELEEGVVYTIVLIDKTNTFFGKFFK